MTDKSSESPEEDAVSLRSNGSLKRMASFRQSFKRMVSPRSSTGSKVKPKADGAQDAAASPAGHDDDASETPERSNDSPEEDAASLGGSSKPLKRLRESMRRVVSPLSNKGSKVNAATPCPPSPSPSSRSGGASAQIMATDEVAAQQDASLKRSQTEPNMSGFGDAIMRRGESIRRSLKFGSNKEKKKASRPPLPIFEGSAAEAAEEEPEAGRKELEETYTLPEIPLNPLSVMQINKLIESEDLEDAHLQLLALRLEFQRERQQDGEDSPVELAKKEKDLSLLYGELREKIRAIVRGSLSRPSDDTATLIHVARIIQEEERRGQEPGGLQGSWMEAWREAVAEGVRASVERVPVETPEQNPAWLSLHLGQLGKTIVEELGKVKDDLRWCYPPSFDVFPTYLRSYHGAVGGHVKMLESRTVDRRDLFALLNWIINDYKSESLMGSPSLQPTTTDQSMEIQLDDDFLPQLKRKYCNRMVADIKFSLQRVVELENADFWKSQTRPKTEDNFLHSQIPFDIWTRVDSDVKNAGRIDAELQQEVTSSCLSEMRGFPERFYQEFRRCCDALPQGPLWTEYRITYINSFTILQDYMQNYQTFCPDKVEAFRKEARWLVLRLTENLEEQFKKEVEMYLRRMLTRKWLTCADDFKQLHRRIEQLGQHCTLMRPPHSQEFASRLHYHVMREYVGQMMKSIYSCKNRKHEAAAEKIRTECGKLRKLFDDMGSCHEWLDHIGDDLSNIVGQKNKADIKNQLKTVVDHYPDFSRKHLVAMLNFRGLVRGREYQRILRRLGELKKGRGQQDAPAPAPAPAPAESQHFFEGMAVVTHTDCLSSLPFSACINLLLPDN